MNKNPPHFRIGHGYDVHAFGEGSHIMLGGVKIPFNKGLVAHSDGDVLIHSICDALLGALALGDIGHHFPDSDDRYRDINSRKLLTQVIHTVTEKGYAIANIDATLIAQKPLLQPFIGAMTANIASDISCPPDCVSIKATTTEGLGFIGRVEGIAAHSVVLIEKHNTDQ